jgi:hypothetical protein
MPFLNYDECDAWFVVSFQLDASFSDCCELMLQNLYQQDMKHAQQLPVGTKIIHIQNVDCISLFPLSTAHLHETRFT